MLNKLRQRYGNFPIFFIIGCSCAALDFTLLYTMTDVLGIWYLYSGIISFWILSVVGFLAHKQISFRDTGTDVYKQYVKFFLVVLVGAFLNNGLLFVFTSGVGLWYIFSRLLSAAITMLWNYFGYNRFVFTERIKQTV